MTKHFFLVLGISLVTLFLNNCSTAHLESQSKSGGVIARDTYLGLGESKAQLEVRAERQCKQYNSNSKAILKFKKYEKSLKIAFITIIIIQIINSLLEGLNFYYKELNNPFFTSILTIITLIVISIIFNTKK